MFGAVGVLSMVRIAANGWVRSLYAGPAHHFTYPGFGWVRPPSAAGMYALVAVVGLAAGCVALGWRYRPALVVFCLGFAWIELIDVTTYLNHYWFMTVAGALMLVAPMDAELALHATRRPVERGWVWLFRFQIAVVYAFAGLAKLGGDWLLHAVPLRLWLPTRTDVAVLGHVLGAPWTAYVLSWAGAAFDCTIVGWLLWRRTRRWAWLVVVAFHVVTWRLFAIGVFPWLMIGATTVFFEPSWPRDLLIRLGRAGRCATARSGAGPDHRLGGRFAVGAAIAWATLQVALPLRHLAIAGDGRWTGEGYRFSWNVLLTERGGDVSFHVTDPTTGRTWTTDGAELFTPLQWKVMSTDAELIRQAAHLLAAGEGPGGGGDLQVRVDAFVSLNGRPAARLIDPTVDLAHEPWRIGHQPWILPAPRTPPP